MDKSWPPLTAAERRALGIAKRSWAPLTPAQRKDLCIAVRPSPKKARPTHWRKPVVAVAGGTFLLFILVHALVGWSRAAEWLGNAFFPVAY